MGTFSSNSVGPFDVSAHISPPGEPDKDGTRVRVATQTRQQLEQRILSVADFCLTEAAPEHLADRIGKEQLQAAASSQKGTPEDDKLAKLETNRSPQGAPETSRLLPADQLSVITVTCLPLVKEATTIPRSTSFEPDRRRSTRMLRRRSDPLSIRTKFLIAIAVAALPAGYFVFGDSDPPVDVAVAPQATANIPPVRSLPLATADIPPVEFLPLREAQAPAATAVGTNAESRIEPEVQTAPLQSTVPPDIKPTENGIEARPPQTLPQKEGQSFAPSQDASTCFHSASAVRQNYPGRWPSWTLRAPGHEGTRCWYAA